MPVTAQSESAQAVNATSSITSVMPNPVTENDAGEFVIVETGPGSQYQLTDGETTVTLPSSSRVAISRHPDIAAEYTNTTTQYGKLWLANGGEELILTRAGQVIDTLAYGRAPEEQILDATTQMWTPHGLIRRPEVRTTPSSATVFVLPDAPQLPLNVLSNATDRVLLAGYTFASPSVAEALISATKRGVNVEILLERGPVGGISTQQARSLDRLVANGVSVRLIGGSASRFSFHHAKYAVVDSRVIVLTENWKPAGTGGNDSRGWGVTLDDTTTAAELTAVFRHDADGSDTRPWSAIRQQMTFVDAEPAIGVYQTDSPPKQVSVKHITILTAPGNAGEAVRDELQTAERSVRVILPRLDPSESYFQTLVAIARQGVSVRILLSNAWYDARDNEALVEQVTELHAQGVPIQARIARPAGQFGKIHAKGAVIDNETAIVGSLNWNRHAETKNREVVFAVESGAAARYYGRVFAADWHNADPHGPRLTLRERGVLLTGAVGAVTIALGSLRRRVTFAS
jgi:cardiolipin synthase